MHLCFKKGHSGLRSKTGLDTPQGPTDVTLSLGPRASQQCPDAPRSLTGKGASRDAKPLVLRVSAPDICPTVQPSSSCSAQFTDSISEQEGSL